MSQKPRRVKKKWNGIQSKTDHIVSLKTLAYSVGNTDLIGAYTFIFTSLGKQALK